MANGINAFAVIALMAIVALAGSQGQARGAAPLGTDLVEQTSH